MFKFNRLLPLLFALVLFCSSVTVEAASVSGNDVLPDQDYGISLLSLEDDGIALLSSAAFSQTITAQELKPTIYPLGDRIDSAIAGGDGDSGTYVFDYPLNDLGDIQDVYTRYSAVLYMDDLPRFIYDTYTGLPAGDVVHTTRIYLVHQGKEYAFSKMSDNRYVCGLPDGISGRFSLRFYIDFSTYYAGTSAWNFDNARLVIANGTIDLWTASSSMQGEVKSFSDTVFERLGLVVERINYLNATLSTHIANFQTSMETNYTDWRDFFKSWMNTLYNHIESQFTQLKDKVTEFQTSMETWFNTVNENISYVGSYINASIRDTEKTIVAKFTELFAKMDEQQNELINGFDPGTGDAANDQLQQSTDDLQGAEDNLFEKTDTNFDFDAYDYSGDNGLIVAWSFVSNLMDAIFKASGPFGSLITIGLTMLVITRLLGYQNFSSGGG